MNDRDEMVVALFAADRVQGRIAAALPASTVHKLPTGLLTEWDEAELLVREALDTFNPAEPPIQQAARVLLKALGDEYQPHNPIWVKVIDGAASTGPDVGKIRGSDAILGVLRALASEHRSGLSSDTPTRHPATGVAE